MGDFLSVWFGAFDKVGLEGSAHSPLQTGPPLPFSSVHKHALDFIHLQETGQIALLASLRLVIESLEKENPKLSVR